MFKCNYVIYTILFVLRGVDHKSLCCDWLVQSLETPANRVSSLTWGGGNYTVWWFWEKREKKGKEGEARVSPTASKLWDFFLEAESSCFKVNGLLPDNTDYCALSRGSAPSGVDQSCRTESLRVDCEFRLRLPASRHSPVSPRTVGSAWTVVGSRE